MAEMKCWVPLIEYNFRDFLKTLDMLKVTRHMILVYVQ